MVLVSIGTGRGIQSSLLGTTQEGFPRRSLPGPAVPASRGVREAAVQAAP